MCALLCMKEVFIDMSTFANHRFMIIYYLFIYRFLCVLLIKVNIKLGTVLLIVIKTCRGEQGIV